MSGRNELGRDTSAAAVDGAAPGRGHHEAVGERQGRQPAQDLWYLCGNCGKIVREQTWTYWQREDDAAELRWRPSNAGEGDPMSKCPWCGWEHVDDDSGPGLWLGTLDEMQAEWNEIVDESRELWRSTARQDVGRWT